MSSFRSKVGSVRFGIHPKIRTQVSSQLGIKVVFNKPPSAHKDTQIPLRWSHAFGQYPAPPSLTSPSDVGDSNVILGRGWNHKKTVLYGMKRGDFLRSELVIVRLHIFATALRQYTVSSVLPRLQIDNKVLKHYFMPDQLLIFFSYTWPLTVKKGYGNQYPCWFIHFILYLKINNSPK